jgi:hypothetical protein
MDLAYKFETPAFPSVHGKTVRNFETAAMRLIDDGADGEPFICLRVGVGKNA